MTGPNCSGLHPHSPLGTGLVPACPHPGDTLHVPCLGQEWGGHLSWQLKTPTWLLVLGIRAFSAILIFSWFVEPPAWCCWCVGLARFVGLCSGIPVWDFPPQHKLCEGCRSVRADVGWFCWDWCSWEMPVQWIQASELLCFAALGKVWLSEGFPSWGLRGLLSQGAAEIGLLETERWVCHCPSATRPSWESTISSVANTRMWSLAGRACPGPPSSGAGLGGPGWEVSLHCSTWTQAALGVLLEHSYRPWVTRRLPNMPLGCMVLRQVCPGRSTKKFLLERGRAGSACAANSQHLSHQQPWAGLKGVCAHSTDSLVTLDLRWGNGVHSSADENCVKLQPVYFIILGEVWLRSCFIRDFGTGGTRSLRNGARQEWKGPHSTKTNTRLGFDSSPVFHS